MRTHGKHPQGPRIDLRIGADPIRSADSDRIRALGCFTRTSAGDSVRYVSLRLCARGVQLADELIARYGLRHGEHGISLRMPRCERWLGKHGTVSAALDHVRADMRARHRAGKLRKIEKAADRRTEYLASLRRQLAMAREAVIDLEAELRAAEADPYRCARPAGTPQHMIGRV